MTQTLNDSIRLVDVQYASDISTHGFVPQAIFWRRIKYFTPEPACGEDGLDEYLFVRYVIGNFTTFEIRKYRQHDRETSTLFLHPDVTQLRDIRRSVKRIVSALRLHRFSLAWLRGQNFEYGVVTRNPSDRLLEFEARLLTLKIISMMPQQQGTVADIQERIPNFFCLSEIDVQLRPRGEEKWRQIVRNVVSNSDGPHSIFRQNYAEFHGGTIILSDLGRLFLRNTGYIRL